MRRPIAGNVPIDCPRELAGKRSTPDNQIIVGTVTAPIGVYVYQESDSGRLTRADGLLPPGNRDSVLPVVRGEVLPSLQLPSARIDVIVLAFWLVLAFAAQTSAVSWVNAMTRTKFQIEWTEIADRWSLTVETPFVVEVSGGQIVVPVLLRDFGALRGMLLLTDYNLIAAYADELVEQGYGFSCLSEPKGEPSNRHDDDNALMEMLADWGWSGEGLPPLRSLFSAGMIGLDPDDILLEPCPLFSSQAPTRCPVAREISSRGPIPYQA